MSEPLDATGVWAQALRALWEAAGRPTGASIRRQAALQVPPLKVTAQSWSDWRNGKNVPVKQATARWLIRFLRVQARRHTPTFVADPDPWWEDAWRRARTERQRSRERDGRPPNPHPAGPCKSADRVRTGQVPQQADCFQARAVADQLERAAPDGPAGACHVLAGMGGVGKTQLAAAYARHCWQEGVHVVVWSTAATRAGIIDAYATSAVKLGIGKDEDPERAAGEFLLWAETTPLSWLVVLDDIQDPADLRGLWPPGSGSGRVVATTRRRDAALAGAQRHVIAVEVFTPTEAEAFLAAKLGDLAPIMSKSPDSPPSWDTCRWRWHKPRPTYSTST